MVSVKVVVKLNTHCLQLALKLIKRINHLRNLVIIVLGMHLNVKLLIVGAALPGSLNKLNQVVYLERSSYVRIRNDNLRCRLQIISKQLLI